MLAIDNTRISEYSISMHGRELLAKFLAEKGLSQAAFSRLSGINTGMICHYLTDDAAKRRRPGLEHAHSIERATDGAVPTEAWIDKPEGENAQGKHKAA